MYALVVEHMQTIEDLSKNYANRNTHLGIDYSDFYDIALAAAMRSASMYLAKHRWGKDRLIEFGDDAQDVRPYKPYLYRAIDNAVIKDVVRKFRRRLQVEMQTDIKQMLREQPGIEPVLKEIPVSDLLQEETEVSSYLRLCADILGPENWYIFCSWVLLDRTQKEIGEDLGVIQTTISARINVILKKCRAITPPQTQILR
jgi:RNA polymerase sigma factor (sigma-70 family)